MYQTFDPFLQKSLKSYELHTHEEVQGQLICLQSTQKLWNKISIEERAKQIDLIAGQVEIQKELLAETASREMGKPIVQARAEVDKSIRALSEIPRLASAFQKQKEEADNYRLILSIQPWNFPYWQVFRMAACAWVTGHTVLLKHSDLVSGCAQLIEDLCVWQNQKILSTVRLDHQDLHALIENERSLGLVTFTGSTQVGRKIAETCGRSLKKSILELGGNDAYFVMPDCDLTLAVQKCVKTRLINSGQSCVAGKRFYLHQKIKQEFVDQFHAQLKKVIRGHPLRQETEVGPASHPRFVLAAKKQIERALELGARWTEIHPFEKQFSAIGTLDFRKSLRAFEDEEIFAPIALFYEFEDIDHCVEAVNAGPYGLAGGIFTGDLELANQVARSSQVGTFTINNFSQSDPLKPFGGTKNSGYGREMGSQGLAEFINWKVIQHG